MARAWRSTAVPPQLVGCGVGGSGPDVVAYEGRVYGRKTDWEQLFAAGLTAAVTAAVDVVGRCPGDHHRRCGEAGPLGAGAALVHRVVPAARLGARLAHRCRRGPARPRLGHRRRRRGRLRPVRREPARQHTSQEWRFILAHEALHAALAHQSRAGGRDHYLWNLAADFVINQWLVEMGVGEMPDGRVPHDPQFAGMSEAESVYDVIAVEARRYRKLATLRGHGSDMLDDQSAHQLGAGAVDLDHLLRRSLATGLNLHTELGRGSLPRRASSPRSAPSRTRRSPGTSPWPAAFDEHFPAVQRERSYARPSRRQSASPDIPGPVGGARRRSSPGAPSASCWTRRGRCRPSCPARPSARSPPTRPRATCPPRASCSATPPRTTPATSTSPTSPVGSGSRARRHPPPAGDPAARAGRRLPRDGAVLVITDGFIDVLRIRRSHALFLAPVGAALPFVPRAPRRSRFRRPGQA